MFAALLWKNNSIMRNEWWVETYGNIAFAAFGAADGLVFSDILQTVIYEEKPGKFNCFLCGSYEIFRTESQFQCLSLVSDEEEL